MTDIFVIADSISSISPLKRIFFETNEALDTHNQSSLLSQLQKTIESQHGCSRSIIPTTVQHRNYASNPTFLCLWNSAIVLAEPDTSSIHGNPTTAAEEQLPRYEQRYGNVKLS
jgi:hypothetical protein